MKYKDQYNDWLDELQPLTGIACNSFSVLLEAGDPIAYNCGYDDYLDANDLNEDEEDEESEEHE